VPVPDYSAPQPAYVQIADDLRGQIAAGRYSPGERLPSNKALSEHYGVASETIRQALDVLRRRKLIATQSTRGTFVLREPSDEEPSAEYAELMSGVHEALRRIEKIEERLSALEGTEGTGQR